MSTREPIADTVHVAVVRELLKRGLAAEGFSTPAVGAKSAEFGAAEKCLRAGDKPNTAHWYADVRSRHF